ncbi:MAG: formylglycine-generating enzyme family protein [Alphaproteobacteria bacterium]|nr:formylglycine-generating enzyme family protein [Alphaproteobacteria bacterium]
MTLRTLIPACLMAVAAPAALAQKAWPAALFNPQAKPDDVVLPMPCGGSMAFRTVYVPGANALDDRRVQLGTPDPRFGYAEGVHTEYLGGGFTDTKQKNQRYYLIGKYEVTRLQYDAVMSGACPEASDAGRLPKTSLSWSEAVTFGGRYSDWLAKNAVGKLPAEDGVAGFVRLPTEAEWEFAARGGVAVAEAEFDQAVFPAPDGVQRYVWHAGTDSSNNELNAVGLLKPNPIGLHDILGNAGEFVLDAFRLNKHSRLHGQAGGYTVKGGDFRTALADIRTSARTEYAPVDKSGERRDPATGFRVALVPLSLPTPQRQQSIRTLWAGLAQSPPGSGAGAQSLADPVKEVEALAKATAEPAMRSRIEKLGTVIKAGIQARNEQRERAAKSEVRVAAYLANKAIEDSRVVAVERQLVATLPKDLVQQAQNQLRRNTENLDQTLSYLIDVLKQIGLDYSSSSIGSQGEILKREFEQRSVAGYGPLIDLVIRFSQGAREGKPIVKSTLLAELTKQGSERRKK